MEGAWGLQPPCLLPLAEIVSHVAFPVALIPLPLPWVAVLFGLLSVISLPAAQVL